MNNKKFLTLEVAGVDYRIPLNNIATIGTNSNTVLRIQYFDLYLDDVTLATSELATIDITHVADTSLNEFKLWFIDRMREILATNWRITSVKETPPLALSAVPA